MKIKRIAVLFWLAVLCNNAAIYAAGFIPASFLVAGLSLEQAVSKVQDLEGGRVLGARTEIVGDKKIHTIKILSPDGSRVRQIRVDSKSGEIDSTGEQ